MAGNMTWPCSTSSPSPISTLARWRIRALYFQLIRIIGPARAAYSTLVVPVIAMALSTAFEGYRWSTLAAMPSGRHGIIAAGDSRAIYIPGGATACATAQSNNLQIFTLQKDVILKSQT